jgi:CRP-like cAMP-binding protein
MAQNKKFDFNYIKSLFKFEKISLERDEILFNEGDLNHYVYFIEAGKIKLLKKKLVVGFTRTHEFVGITSCLCENENYYFSAIASECALLLRIQKTIFKEVLNNNPELGKTMIGVLCDRLSWTDNKTNSFMHHGSKERVINEILINQYSENNTLYCDLTRKDLSELTNNTLKNTYEILIHLERIQLIKKESGRIEILNLQKLAERLR